jgi:hypothetical protein
LNPFQHERSILMRFVTSSVRTLRVASGILLLWLLSAIAAEAAPPPHGATPGSVCDGQTLTLKKLRRQPKAFGGPLKRLKRRAVTPLTDLSSRMLRGSRAQLDDDDAAIQNDAPAARIDDDEQPIPALRPLGVLHGTLDQRLPSPLFSPRSPRGPPPHV